MDELPIEFYKDQYDKLLNHNQELQIQVDSLKKRIGGRKPADRLKYLGMHRLGIKKAIRLFGYLGLCWFYSSKSINKKL